MLCYSPHKKFTRGYCIVQNPHTFQSVSFGKAKLSYHAVLKTCTSHGQKEERCTFLPLLFVELRLFIFLFISALKLGSIQITYSGKILAISDRGNCFFLRLI